MSLKTWKDVYYPVRADSPEAQASPLTAAVHSLHKWHGLRSHVLELYGVERNGGVLVCKSNYDKLTLWADNCALCRFYEACGKMCNGCPLAAVIGIRCDRDNGTMSHYAKYTKCGDPEPMIEALEKAVANVANEKVPKDSKPELPTVAEAWDKLPFGSVVRLRGGKNQVMKMQPLDGVSKQYVLLGGGGHTISLDFLFPVNDPFTDQWTLVDAH